MLSRIFGKRQSIYGNYGRFGQKNSSATRRITQKPRYLYKESFYTNKPKPMMSRSHAHQSHKSILKHAKSKRLGINNSHSHSHSHSVFMHKSRKNRSRSRY